MKLGLMIGYSGARLNLPIARIKRAEEIGFDSVWTAEAYGSDAITPLAHIGAVTSRIKLATGIAQLAARTPAALAMAAQTIDALSGSGRMILGIGVSGPQIVEGWYGQPWGKPAERLRDYVAIIKKVLKRDAPVTHSGSEISLPYTGPGSSGIAKPLKSILHGNPDIPIVLGTVTPGNVRLTAEIAEGWLVMHFVPGLMKEYRPLIEAGLKKRTDGLTLDRFDMTGMVAVHVDQDVKKAIDAEKPELALYVGGMGAKGKNFHKERMVARGYGAAADRIQELYLAGRKDEAIAAVPDDYIDEGALIGPPDRIRQRWPAWRDSGLTRLAIHHPTDEAVEVMAKVAF